VSPGLHALIDRAGEEVESMIGPPSGIEAAARLAATMLAMGHIEAAGISEANRMLGSGPACLVRSCCADRRDGCRFRGARPLAHLLRLECFGSASTGIMTEWPWL